VRDENETNERRREKRKREYGRGEWMERERKGRNQS